MRRVALENLEAGVTVAKSIYDEKGRLLLGVGMKLKQEYILKLQQLGISSIYVEDNLIPDVYIKDIVEEKTRLKAQHIVRDILENVSNQPVLNSSQLLFIEKELRTLTQDILGQIIDQKDMVVNLSDIRSADSYTFAHCVNVGILAVATALSQQCYNIAQLEALGVGSMLHDLGKVTIPPMILNKPAKLSPHEFAIMREHPIYGLKILKGQNNIDTPVKLIVHQHHERINGSGYPRKLKGKEIHPLAQICSICDVYDAMISDRPYRRGLLPHQIIEHLESSTDQFDGNLLQNFFKNIAAYPIGTFVKLSNELIGIVVNNTRGFPTRPKVRVFYHPENYFDSAPYDIDLMENINIIVRGVVKENDIPIESLNLLKQKN